MSIVHISFVEDIYTKMSEYGKVTLIGVLPSV